MTTTTAAVEGPTLTVHADESGGAVLQFAGPWQSQHGLAEPTSLLDELRSRAIHHVAFDASQVTAWDSGLVTFVLKLLRDHSTVKPSVSDYSVNSLADTVVFPRLIEHAVGPF